MSRKIHSGLALTVAAVLTLAGPAVRAQTPPPAPPTPAPVNPAASLTAEARKSVVSQIAANMRGRYIFLDTGEAAAARIEAQQASGAYNALTDPADFAKALNQDLTGVAHDLHLQVIAPGRGLALPGAPAPAPPSEGGVVRADRLPGNIGYVEIIGFPPRAAFKPAFDRAMAGLADTKALIIDARRHHGGALDGDAYVLSFMTPDDHRMPVNTMRQRKAGTPDFDSQVIYTVATPTKYLGKPVYLLTSHETVSGGEALAYSLQSFKAAKIVGETTAGGANPGGVLPLPNGFGIFLPNGQPENMVTHTNWEGKGVVPDIPTPRAEALKVALEQLGQHPTSGEVAALSEAKLFTIRDQPMPGTEVALRKIITGLTDGSPPYDLVGPGLGAAFRRDTEMFKAKFATLGPLQSVTFKGPAGAGDSFVAAFAHGSMAFSVVLDDSGTVNGFLFGPA